MDEVMDEMEEIWEMDRLMWAEEELRLDEEIERSHLEQLWAMAEEDERRREEEENREPKHIMARPVSSMALSHNGGRQMTRGWRGARFVKQQTNRAMRRLARQDPENAPTQRRVNGWIW